MTQTLCAALDNETRLVCAISLDRQNPHSMQGLVTRRESLGVAECLPSTEIVNSFPMATDHFAASVPDMASSKDEGSFGPVKTWAIRARYRTTGLGICEDQRGDGHDSVGNGAAVSDCSALSLGVSIGSSLALAAPPPDTTSNEAVRSVGDSRGNSQVAGSGATGSGATEYSGNSTEDREGCTLLATKVEVGVTSGDIEPGIPNASCREDSVGGEDIDDSAVPECRSTHTMWRES